MWDERCTEHAVLGGPGYLEQHLTLVRREGSDEDQADNVALAGGRVRDHRTPIGVPDRKDRTRDLVDESGDVRAVALQTAQRVGSGDHLDALGLQALDHTGPTRTFCEGAVHEQDGELITRVVSDMVTAPLSLSSERED